MKGIRRTLAAFLCVFGVLTTANATEYEGIDVSVWQGTIDFEEVKSAGKEIVYIRAGYGATEDSRFKTNAHGANAAGLNVGYYFFVTAETADEAETQAEFFSSLIENTAYNCRPAVDFETFTGLTDAEINAVALAFSEALERETGHVPLFYTDASNAESLWEESLAAYPLWVADYGVSAPTSIGAWETWAGFQYSDEGRVSGISGDVDLDRFTDSVFIGSDGGTLPFSDVLQNDWFYGSVLALYNDGLINGTTPTTFSPYSNASRAVPVTVLYRLDGSPAVSGNSGFSDVEGGLWFSDSVTWAAQNNIAEGFRGGIFDPLAGATREELAVFLYRYAVYKDYDTEERGSLSPYTDSGLVSDWAETAVRWAVGTGIIKGVTSDVLAPQSIADRAETAVMLSRFKAVFNP